MTAPASAEPLLPLPAWQPEEAGESPSGEASLRKIVFDFLYPVRQQVKQRYSRGFYFASLLWSWSLIALIFCNLLQALMLVVALQLQFTLDQIWLLIWSADFVSVVTTVTFSLEYCLRFWVCVEEQVEGAQLHRAGSGLNEELLGLGTRLSFFFEPMNLLDFFTCSLLWVLLLYPSGSSNAGEASIIRVLTRIGGSAVLRSCLAALMLGGGITRTSFRELTSPRRRKRQKSKLSYDPNSDKWQWSAETEESPESGKSPKSPKPDVWSNPKEEDAFGFDPKTGLYFRILLIIIASGSSIVSFGVDRGSQLLLQLREWTLQAVIEASGYRLGESRLLEVAVMTGVNVVLLWPACLLVRTAPQAAGSGLPEVKCILSGVPLDKFLTRPVLRAKAVALTLVLGESLPVGKEGPFVHIASCISSIMLKTPFFKRMSLPRKDVLLAAVAVGVGATFSAPVGGVLFALELMMPRMYDTASYAACFFASVTGTLVYMCLNMFFTQAGQLKPLFTSDITAESSPSLQAELVFILMCAGIGAICGSAGSAFVLCHRRAVAFMNGLRGLAPLCGSSSGGPSLRRDLLIFFGVAAAGALLRTCGGVGSLLDLGAGPLLTEIFSADQVRSQHLNSPGTLSLLFLVRIITTVLALSLPVPAGVVAPSLILGGLLGRLLSTGVPHGLQRFLSPSGDFGQYVARFAIVGATTFCGSVCRVNSVVVTVFELIAVPRLILPLTLATLVANYCGNKVGPSIFDSILLMKKIPAMPTLRASFKALQPVSQILDSRLLQLCLPRYPSPEDFERVLELRKVLQTEEKNIPLFVPIVEEETTKSGSNQLILAGSIDWKNLEYLQHRAYDLLEGSSPRCAAEPANVTVTTGTNTGFDIIGEAVKSGRVLKDPLQIMPNISLKQAYLESQSVSRDGPMLVVQDGILLGILPHDDLLAEASRINESARPWARSTS
eukprot:TRINITY_DN107491_c0_g1_i1.p1 TRINITY_DN107491_c0_g1~~TRINITY_DN107491_c0_g1_i1.p1  ORF type:complete len:949 (-),score=139.09 TRINITY_DN107491_c0_g1_i1:65-2911(-)